MYIYNNCDLKKLCNIKTNFLISMLQNVYRLLHSLTTGTIECVAAVSIQVRDLPELLCNSLI